VEGLGCGADGVNIHRAVRRLHRFIPLCYSCAVIALIEQQKAGIADLCQRHEVRRLDLFGSAAHGDFQPEQSDLDFIVQFTRTGYAGYANAFLEFADALERLLGRKVDLLTERMIRNPYFRSSVEATRQIVYEK
jgi:predicted nucleotidyltransferase